MRVLSATGSCRDSRRNAAKCEVFGPGTSYFSDINDLLAAERGIRTPESAFDRITV